MAAKRQRLVSKESESKLAAVVATEQVVDAINVAGLPTGFAPWRVRLVNNESLAAARQARPWQNLQGAQSHRQINGLDVFS